MGYEISAGVILFRSVPQREYLILDYGSHWDFSKGHIEPGEDPATTARRELAEETGIQDPRFIPGYEERMSYAYRRAGELMRAFAGGCTPATTPETSGRGLELIQGFG